MTKAQFPVGTFINNLEGDTALNTQLTQSISFWSGKVTDGAYSVFRSHREFFASFGGRNIETGMGPFVTAQMLNSRSVYNAHQPGFPLHLLGDQLQKAGVSGDQEDGWLENAEGCQMYST